jgi:hypothetical protein
MSGDLYALLVTRHAFFLDYCRERGWTADGLSLEQILEIRAQDGWKNPTPPGRPDGAP